MSVFGDFQQVWLQRFPESPLPGAWEEDVRANLAKHKQKVSLLKEELEKEQFYVEYLERLLSDVEQHKIKLAREKSIESEETGDVTADTISKKDPGKPSTVSLNVEETETLSANMCVNEISKQMIPKDSHERYEPTAPPDQDPGTFVTVIEVNGVKQGNISPVKTPPKVPSRPDSLKSKTRRSNSDSISSSSEFLTTVDEPYYDRVAPEDDYLVESNHSSTENVFSSSSTLLLESKRDSTQNIPEPQSPGTSNYVNIEYFISSSNKKNGNSHSSSEDEQDEITELRRHNDNSSYASSSSLESNTPASRRKFSQDSDKGEFDRDRMYKSIFYNITESESNYVDWLSVLLKYMKAIQATIGTSQPIVSEAELNTIFYKIPDLYSLHSNFLEALRRHVQKWDTRIGEHFKIMASNLSLYGAFLSNYGQALDTVQKCSAANSQFGEISKNITCKQLSGQPISLEDLLHKPVARVQKNALVLHDLLKYVPPTHVDHHSLTEALNLTQNFLDQFNMIQTKLMFPVADRAQRRLVKNSFIVEFVDGNRKLRHLFLFNDVIACAKYKTAGRAEKYTFELKWFIPVEDIIMLEETTANLHEIASSNIVSLKSQASNVRDQLRQEDKANENRSKQSRGSDKFRKRLIELESQLVLVSPNLVYRIKNKMTGRTYMFFLSSDFERTQWIEAIQTLQKTERTGKMNAPPISELQTWITACRSYLKTNMGSYLLRSGNDERLLVGDLHVFVYDLCGLDYSCGKRQKRNIPFIITACIREVERRGMSEVGIYRVSGSALDISKLKKSFETNSYEAEQLLKEVDIHSVTGILRLYLRELPEALFTDQRYPELLEAFNNTNGNLKKRTELLNECFSKLPEPNKQTITFILEHLMRIHRHESENKMSLHNLATVFGPTLLRPGLKPDLKQQKDLLAAGTVDVMAQAGILYCYLQDLLNNSQRICR
nr:active breakpoint cluster region-related protein [Leptinotarsa decemlineata]